MSAKVARRTSHPPQEAISPGQAVPPLSEEGLRLCMPEQYRDLPVYIFETLDSTNTRARELAQDGAPHGTVVIARQQTSGRGRLGRSFFSPKDGIYLSVVIRLASGGSRSDAAPFSPTLVTAAAAVAAAESIEAVCGLEAGIKWVNDIYVNGKKVCGILTEGIMDAAAGRIDAMVVGIGINTTLNGFPDELQDVAGAVEGNYSNSALAASVICKCLDLAAAIDQQSAAQNDPPRLHFIDTYRERSLVIGKTVTVYKGIYRQDPTKELGGRAARVLDIDASGGLCVLYADGTRETLTSGEISIRPEGL